MISILRTLNRWMEKVESVMSWAAVAVLAAMMGLVNLNVFIRPLGMPIWGVFEVVGFLGALLISFALIYPTLHGTTFRWTLWWTGCRNGCEGFWPSSNSWSGFRSSD